MLVIELNKLVRRLDRRISRAPTRGTIQPKKRERSALSDSVPPPLCPEWTVNSNYTLPNHSPDPTPSRQQPCSRKSLAFIEADHDSTSSSSDLD